MNNTYQMRGLETETHLKGGSEGEGPGLPGPASVVLLGAVIQNSGIWSSSRLDGIPRITSFDCSWPKPQSMSAKTENYAALTSEMSPLPPVSRGGLRTPAHTAALGPGDVTCSSTE